MPGRWHEFKHLVSRYIPHLLLQIVPSATDCKNVQNGLLSCPQMVPAASAAEAALDLMGSREARVTNVGQHTLDVFAFCV